MQAKRVTWVMVVIVSAAAAGLWIWRDAVFGEPNPATTAVDEKSADLAHDLKLMWETRPLSNPDESHGANPRCSTDRAINAASRVFNTVELAGKSNDDVIALLGDPKTSNESTYNFPFYPPASPKSLVYRFDSGAYGWQFDIVFDGNGRVHEVVRQGIE